MVLIIKITFRIILSGIFNTNFPEVAFFPTGYLFNKDFVFIMARTKKLMNVHHLEAKWLDDFFRVDNELCGFLFSSYWFNSSRKITSHFISTSFPSAQFTTRLNVCIKDVYSAYYFSHFLPYFHF